MKVKYKCVVRYSVQQWNNLGGIIIGSVYVVDKDGQPIESMIKMIIYTDFLSFYQNNCYVKQHRSKSR